MFAKTHPSRNDVGRILLLAVLATLFALAVLTRLGGAGGGGPASIAPRYLGQARQDAIPLETAVDDAARASAIEARRVRKILDLHRAGRPAEAVAAWKAVTLPYPTAGWQHVAIAAAELQLGHWNETADALDVASRIDDGNPLVHYFTALLRLEQAAAAKQWPDAVGPQTMRLAGWVPRNVTPNTRSTYELVALQELHLTIKLANRFYPGEPLLPDYGRLAEPAPTVGDLLRALGDDQFEADAHHVLSHMYLVRAELERAEEHLDQAVALGATVIGGYSELGAAYNAAARHGDAMRAYAKAVEHEHGGTAATRQLLHSFLRALGFGR